MHKPHKVLSKSSINQVPRTYNNYNEVLILLRKEKSNKKILNVSLFPSGNFC